MIVSRFKSEVRPRFGAGGGLPRAPKEEYNGGCLRSIYGGTLRLARGHAKFERPRHGPLRRGGGQEALGTARKPRADAQRNRDGLLEAAKAAFAEAADAGLTRSRGRVGIGTLYRHFPTRDAIVEAVYRREVQQLADAAPRLADSLPRWRPCAPGCGSSSITSPPRKSSRGSQIAGRRRLGALCQFGRADH